MKQMEKTRKTLEVKLKKLQSTDRKDDVVTFEQLGVDRLFVDESQNYKNLYLYTRCAMLLAFLPPKHRSPAICSASVVIWMK